MLALGEICSEGMGGVEKGGEELARGATCFEGTLAVQKKV